MSVDELVSKGANAPLLQPNNQLINVFIYAVLVSKILLIKNLLQRFFL